MWEERSKVLQPAGKMDDFTAVPSTQVVMWARSLMTHAKSAKMHQNILQATPQELRVEQRQDTTLKECREKLVKTVANKHSGVTHSSSKTDFFGDGI